MIWLTWRQHRQQALFALIGLAALSALMVPSGRQMHRVLVESGLADCLDRLGRSQPIPPNPVTAATDCDALAGAFTTRFGALTWLGTLFLCLPVLIGMFWGAPLVAREVEHGTHRLVWTQSVTRARWALVKFGLVATGALTVAAAYSLLLSWWIAPLNRVDGSRFSSFLDGTVPVGYTLFAVALGILAGAVTRKVLPAMAVTLVGFVVVRAVTSLMRSRLLTPSRRTYPVANGIKPDRLVGDWILDVGVYTAAGQRIGTGGETCSMPSPDPSATPGLSATPVLDCAATHPAGSGSYNLETYHPAGRFWLFQTIETGLFTALAVGLLVAAVVLVRRRVT